MIFYSLTIPNNTNSILGCFSNRTKLLKAIQHIKTNFGFDNVEFVGVFDLQNATKKVNTKNLNFAISLLNDNEAFGLNFSNSKQEIIVDVTKLTMNPEHSTIFIPKH